MGFALLVLSGCPNNTKDSHCVPDAPSRADDPSCIYAGSGKGPAFVESECVVDGTAPAVCPTFYDVFDAMRDPAKGNCTSGSCHGSEATSQSSIYFSAADPQQVYEALTSVEGTVGTPYVDPGGTGWMYCNVTGAHGGGFAMPPPGGMPTLADADLIRDWILCGAEPPAECPAVAGDGACVACGKAKCCGQTEQCKNDATCAACLACVVMNGGLAMCTAECDAANTQIDALSACVTAQCMTECP